MKPITNIAPKIGKILPRLANDHDGEVVTTAQAIQRTLKSEGLDLHDLAGALNSSPPLKQAPKPSRRPKPHKPLHWFHLCDACLDWPTALTEKEAAFLRDIGPRLVVGLEPSERQAAWIRDIYAKVAKAAGGMS